MSKSKEAKFVMTAAGVVMLSTIFMMSL